MTEGLSCFWDALGRAGATWVAGGASKRAGSTVASQKTAATSADVQGLHRYRVDLFFSPSSHSMTFLTRMSVVWMAYVATTGALTGEMVRDLMVESVEYRFGAGVTRTPHPVEWLSDNGPPYTALETRSFGASLGLAVCTTPAYSPESNRMAECFVKSFKRDYVYLNRLDSAEAVMRELARWIDDYNEMHPHKGLKMRSPREYRRLNQPVLA